MVYIDHHCCGDMYLEPWGWTEELPPDHDDIDKVWSAAKAATDLLYGRCRGPAVLVLPRACLFEQTEWVGQ